ncbi:MAG: CDP-alcohol phosphatidyltransferase family protein [Bryobacteraceae bacterium]
MHPQLEVSSQNPAAAKTSGFVNAVRLHESLTAKIEKRILIWLAQRMPAAVSPDHLTALALVSQICAGAAYALAAEDDRSLWLVNLFLLLNWFGDSLDGTLARVRNQQRPRYGFYVDHIADTFGALALMTGLALSGFVHWQIAIAMLLGFYVLSIESYLSTYTTGYFRLSHGAFGPTEIRILITIGNVFLFTHPKVTIAGGQYLLFDIGGVVAVTGMTVMALAAVAKQTAHLYRQETCRQETCREEN